MGNDRRLRIVLFLLLIIHGGITLHSLQIHGLLSPFPPFDNWRSIQLFSDLSVSTILLLYLILRHPTIRTGSRRWLAPALVLGAFLTGSLSTLLFLLLAPRIVPVTPAVSTHTFRQRRQSKVPK